MAVTLQKPLGSDIYNIDVFNANSAIIEEYLNRLTNESDISFKVYYYPETSEVFNIDTAITGIHICSNLDPGNLQGTYPSEDSKWYFEVLSFIKADALCCQVYVDMSEGHNKLYVRSKLSNSTWTTWTAVGSGGGGGTTTDGLQVIYASTIDLDNPKSGIYFCNSNTTIESSEIHEEGYKHPKDITNSKQFQYIAYGDESTTVIKTQLFTNLDEGSNESYSRIKYKNSKGNFVWSNWKKLDSGGSSTSDIKISLVEL